MTYHIERTEKEILIRLPIASTPKQVQNALNFLRYLELGEGNTITESQVQELVDDSKRKWWADNKDKFFDQAGFENIDEWKSMLSIPISFFSGI